MTVDEIHAAAQDAAPGVGIATIYRTVKLLLDAREIQSVILPDGQLRYEAADLDHHHHFRCRVCGGVFSPAMILGSMTGGAFGIIAAKVFTEVAEGHGS